MKTDRVVSLTAMLIGLGSLFIIVYQTWLLREQQKASALPYLMMGLRTNGDRTFIVVRNTGVGPALIEDVVLHYEGRDIHQDPYDFVIEVRPDSVKDDGVSVDRLMPGRLVSAGEGIEVLGTETDGQGMVRTLLGVFDLGEIPQNWYDNFGVQKSGADKAIIDVTYHSVYGDRWRV